MEDLLSTLESLRESILTQVPFSEHERRLHPDIAAALADGGFYRLWIPRTFGGFELSVPDAARVFEAAARIDGSAGWAVTIGTGGGVFGATLAPETARGIFERPDALIAGSGMPSGTATVIDGGYMVSGQWHYASGIHYATTVTASCRLVSPDGQPILDAAGNPVIRAVAFEPGQVEILDTWDTLGMRGTGSHDFRAHAVFVPEPRTFSVFGEPYEPGPLYRYPFGAIAAASFASVALGLGAHLLDEFDSLAREKTLTSGSRLAETATARSRLAEARSALSAARDGFYAEVNRSWVALVADGALHADAERRVAHASIHAARTALRAANSLFEIGGMAPLHSMSALGRCWRDLHTVCHHGVLSPLLLEQQADL